MKRINGYVILLYQVFENDDPRQKKVGIEEDQEGSNLTHQKTHYQRKRTFLMNILKLNWRRRWRNRRVRRKAGAGGVKSDATKEKDMFLSTSEDEDM